MTLKEKIRVLEAAWKDAQREAEDEKNPIGVREIYNDIAQRHFMKMLKFKEQAKKQAK